MCDRPFGHTKPPHRERWVAEWDEPGGEIRFYNGSRYLDDKPAP